MTFGEKLRQLREGRDWSQERLAWQIGTEEETIFQWEADEATPDVASLRKLANLYGLTLDALTDLEQLPPAPPADSGNLDETVQGRALDRIFRQKREKRLEKDEARRAFSRLLILRSVLMVAMWVITWNQSGKLILPFDWVFMIVALWNHGALMHGVLLALEAAGCGLGLLGGNALAIVVHIPFLAMLAGSQRIRTYFHPTREEEL